MPPFPMQSTGFPASYPYAQSMPMPSAILRPLQQPLYDSEIIPASAISELIYFQRQLGQTMANAVLTKSIADTNLQQPGQLANPLEFSLFGFVFEVSPKITFVDYQALYDAGVFVFTYTGNRVYLQIPLTRIPQGVAPEGFAATAVGGTPLTAINIHNGVGHVSNQYKFTIGRAALRIRPTESFQVRLAWGAVVGALTSNSVTLATATRTRVLIQGLQWTPL